MANLILKIVTSLDPKGLKEAERKIGRSLGGALKAGGAVAAGALGAVGAGAIAAGASAVAFADETNAAMENFRQQTGLSEQGVERFKQSAQGLFAAGVGEGMEDIANVMAEVANITQGGAETVEDFSKKALVLRDRFDKDVGESIDAVNVLMREMGLSSDEAFDFVVSGIQGGLDANGDFLDTIREYGNLFGNAGFDAAQFYSILETGSEGGVLGTDKIADAVKELGIRLNEADEDAAAAFESLTGASFEDVQASIASGDEAWADYFDNIIGGLQSIEDPLERNRLQTELFGTMAEDLGADFVEAIDPAATSLQDMSGSMQNVEDRNMTLSEGMTTLGRQLMVALEPAAQTLMPMFAEGIRIAGDFLTDAAPVFQEFAGNLSNTLGPALQIIGESLLRIAEAFGLVSEDAEGSDQTLEALATTLDLVVTGVEALALAFHAVAEAVDLAKGLIDQMGTISDLAGQKLGAEEGAGLFGRDGALNIFGFQGGGVVPGTPGQAVPAVLHGGEEIANPNIGQAIVIGGEQFAVREAQRLAAAINSQRQRDFQEFTNTLAGALG